MMLWIRKKASRPVALWLLLSPMGQSQLRLTASGMGIFKMRKNEMYATGANPFAYELHLFRLFCTAHKVTKDQEECIYHTWQSVPALQTIFYLKPTIQRHTWTSKICLIIGIQLNKVLYIRWWIRLSWDGHIAHIWPWNLTLTFDPSCGPFLSNASKFHSISSGHLTIKKFK